MFILAVLIRGAAQGSHGYRYADVWAFAAARTGMTVRPPAAVP